MASPTYLGKVQTGSLAETASSLTLPAMTLQAGDLVVLHAVCVQGTSVYGSPTSVGAPNPIGTAWTLRQDARVSQAGQVTVWTASATQAGSVTVTVPRTAGGERWGLFATLWRNATVGASAKATNPSGAAPQVALTTTAAGSAVDVAIADYWENNSARSWLTTAGTSTEILYSYNAGHYSVFGGIYPDVGAAGVKPVGMVTPPSQGYGIVAVEVVYALPASTAQAPGIADDGGVGTPSAIYGPTATAEGLPPDGGVGTPAVTVSIGWVSAPGIGPEGGAGTPKATAAPWREVTEGDTWRRAVTSPERTVGYRVELIDTVSREHRLDLPVTDGSISFSGDDVEQFACSLTVVGEEWVPQKATDPLGPVSGLLCRVWWQVSADGMSPMEIPCGTFVLEDPKVTDGGAGAPTVTVTGRDPLALIRRTGYGSATVSVGGLTAPAALAAILRAVAPTTPTRIDTTSTVLLPAVYELGTQDVGKDLTEISGLAGYICRTDREGTVTIGPSPEPGDPVADWQEGPDCVVVDVTRSIDTARMVNSVTVTSSSTEVDPPVVGFAEDDDPSSPTYVGGPFGRRGIAVQSDAATTDEAAASLARQYLSGRRRPTEQVDVTVLPRADLDYRDVVTLYRPAAGVGGLYRIGGWTLPIVGPGQDPPLMRVTLLPRVTL